MKRKVLFIDSAHPVLQQQLEKMGFVCDYYPNFKRKDYEACIEEYTGIIVRSKIRIDREFLEKAVRLQFVGRVGAGMEGIDVLYAESKGIRCMNSPEGNRDAVGEHALGMLLCLLNNINKADQEIRQGLWRREPNRGQELMGKTIALIGYGNMGGAFARRLFGFGAKVIAYDKYRENFTDRYADEATMNEVFEQADVVSLHVPLTKETTYLVNGKWIEQFKKPFILLNTARGKVVNTKNLVEALKSGKVIAAGLDVLEYEEQTFEKLYKRSIPGPLQYLIEADNVVLTPHIAGWTHQSNQKMAEVLAAKIKKLKNEKGW